MRTRCYVPEGSSLGARRRNNPITNTLGGRYDRRAAGSELTHTPRLCTATRSAGAMV